MPNGKQTESFTQRFSSDNLALLMLLQKATETYSDTLAKVIASHRAHGDRGETLNFKKLGDLRIPEEIVSKNSGLKGNGITYKLTIEDLNFLEEAMQHYQQAENMLRPPRQTWFLGQLIQAYFFQEVKKTSVYITQDKEAVTTTLCPFCQEGENLESKSMAASPRGTFDIRLKIHPSRQDLDIGCIDKLSGEVLGNELYSVSFCPLCGRNLEPNDF